MICASRKVRSAHHLTSRPQHRPARHDCVLSSSTTQMPACDRNAYPPRRRKARKATENSRQGSVREAQYASINTSQLIKIYMTKLVDDERRLVFAHRTSCQFHRHYAYPPHIAHPSCCLPRAWAISSRIWRFKRHNMIFARRIHPKQRRLA